MFRLSFWLSENPVLQRELARRVPPPTFRRNAGAALGILSLWLLYVGVGWLLSGLAVTPWQGRLFLLAASLAYLLLITLMIPGPAAALITGERERGTLQSLLLTRITPAQVVCGKLLIALRPAGVLFALALPLLLMGAHAGRLPVGHAVLLLWLLALAPVPAATGSLWLSGRCRSSRNATILAYLLTFGAYWGTLAVFPPLLVRRENLWWYLSPAWQAAVLCLTAPNASPLARPILPEWAWFTLGAVTSTSLFLWLLYRRFEGVE